MTKAQRIDEAESRQAERVTEGRYGLTGRDVEDLLLLATELPTFAGWCDRRTVAELARRALYGHTEAATLRDIAARTADPLDRARLERIAAGLEDFASLK